MPPPMVKHRKEYNIMPFYYQALKRAEMDLVEAEAKLAGAQRFQASFDWFEWEKKDLTSFIAKCERTCFRLRSRVEDRREESRVLGGVS